MRQLGIISAVFLLFNVTIEAKEATNAKTFRYEEPVAFSQGLKEKADLFFHSRNYSEALKTYELLLLEDDLAKAPIFKKMALSHAALNHPSKSVTCIEQYLLQDFDPNIFLNDGFESIKNSAEFREAEKSYSPKITIWSFLYLYVALIGFYLTIVINFNRNVDPVSKKLISAFIFIHSFFIFHICLNITNYQYIFSHSYLMSTVFSFLYGPLLYFYFKRTTQLYRFKVKDLLHLIPTLLFLVYILPIYAMSASEKLTLMMGRFNNGQNPTDSKDVAIIVTLKLTSLILYGYFIGKLYVAGRQNTNISRENKLWQKSIYGIHIAYILSYAVYGILISTNIWSGFFYHSQIICMALMVLYVGYSANVQPSVFSGVYSYKTPLLFKYKNSGLTESLSSELKENLIRLFDEFKIYKENDISLEILSDRLNTTRHNASQVINEHFKMNFHELINTYRIREAKQILDNGHLENLNIIDIAYEVGYNNKVTFNKAFKKDTNLTPTEYHRSLVSSFS
ncbi:helix-turn-helix domain-containing protein [Spongiimicrobium sp. 3-5]|uniref:helix-turn-helix domain-containing protein n=1 Tax=Spongiimicrobium sp. 3-5 TaxID=3332596 RepID=UPI00397F7AD5